MTTHLGTGAAMHYADPARLAGQLAAAASVLGSVRGALDVAPRPEHAALLAAVRHHQAQAEAAVTRALGVLEWPDRPDLWQVPPTEDLEPPVAARTERPPRTLSPDEVATRDSETRGGELCWAGTRVPVVDLLDAVLTGQSIADWLTGHPSVRREQVAALLRRLRNAAMNRALDTTRAEMGEAAQWAAQRRRQRALARRRVGHAVGEVLAAWRDMTALHTEQSGDPDPAADLSADAVVAPHSAHDDAHDDAQERRALVEALRDRMSAGLEAVLARAPAEVLRAALARSTTAETIALLLGTASAHAGAAAEETTVTESETRRHEETAMDAALGSIPDFPYLET